jgi:hypothetical protein
VGRQIWILGKTEGAIEARSWGCLNEVPTNSWLAPKSAAR